MASTSRFRLNRPASSPIGRMLQHGDIPYRVILVISALLILGLMVGVGVMLWAASAATRNADGFSFITATDWNPVAGKFGAMPFIAGTLSTSLVALALAVPLGLAIAVFLAELCPPRLRATLGYLVELLAAIPSVVYGAWGIFVFIPTAVQPLGNFLLNTFGDPKQDVFLPIFEGPFFGASFLAAGLILAVMILPTITAISRDVLLAVPRSQREGAYGVGCTQWETIWKVVLPYSLSGILGAVILGLGRALGETMAVTMVIGNVSQLSASLLSPGYTMASVIANEWGESRTAAYSSALLEIGLLLFIMSLLLNLLARLLVWSVARRNPEQRS
ncbi:MAG: phosphate ABC transporter permease subunit PstC [Chloroflexi bacterium]|nr:phosphate ABC transporter permease subunit PstC [Chloroflexota bacterium]